MICICEELCRVLGSESRLKFLVSCERAKGFMKKLKRLLNTNLLIETEIKCELSKSHCIDTFVERVLQYSFVVSGKVFHKRESEIVYDDEYDDVLCVGMASMRLCCVRVKRLYYDDSIRITINKYGLFNDVRNCRGWISVGILSRRSSYASKSTAKKPSAYEIHQWLVETMRVNTDQVDTIQLHNRDFAIYLKLVSVTLYNKLLNEHKGDKMFKYESEEEIQIVVSAADIQSTTVRIFNLPPEIPNIIISNTLSKYGQIHDIRSEKWNDQYPLPVNNGVKAVKMDIKIPIPTLLKIGMYTASLNYPGQIQVCFRCGEPGHFKQDCKQQFTTLPIRPHNKNRLLSDIVRQHTLINCENVLLEENQTSSIQDSTAPEAVSSQHMDIPTDGDLQGSTEVGDTCKHTIPSTENIMNVQTMPTDINSNVDQREENEGPSNKNYDKGRI
ncbi:hypothetical protein ANN_01480 [Periplaneta americana]|uniref:CCHC-type domain-containing protein n=1 Tax=Periplaneta americana TaxID=6978 RepID=A0ABQ8TTP1_PERAM|nr:hypothetical protein ANN_01480 [Periplaneta americana]